jgi:hypothetical protein
MIYHVTIFIAIAAVFFETAIANMTVTFPGGPDQWWGESFAWRVPKRMRKINH